MMRTTMAGRTRMNDLLAAVKAWLDRGKNKWIVIVAAGAAVMLIGAGVMIGGVAAARERQHKNNAAAIVRVRDFNEKARAAYDELIYATGGGRTVEDNSILPVGEQGIIGFLSVPSIALDVPVMASAVDEAVELSVCRYQGAPWEGYTVIVGDDYDSEFGRLSELKAGDEVLFTGLTPGCCPNCWRRPGSW